MWSEKGELVTDFAIPSEPLPASPRYHLWVDGVGGYLLCLADEISLGGLAPRDSADVSLLADLRRRHAYLRRSGGDYVLHPEGAVSVDGEPIDAPRLLPAACELTLGRNVEVSFAVPNPLSNTAVLRFQSLHRPVQALDGVLLMAETCVIGPAADHHVVCANWSSSLVFYRRERELFCQTEPDGRDSISGSRSATIQLTYGGEVAGDDFRISLERIP